MLETRLGRSSIRWQRDVIVGSSCISLELSSINRTCGEGSSKILRRQLEASEERASAFWMMNTLWRPSNGGRQDVACISLIWFIPISAWCLESKPTIWTSGCFPSNIRRQASQEVHGLSCALQLTDCAKVMASVLLPTCGGPTNKYAWESRPCWELRSNEDIVSGCPITFHIVIFCELFICFSMLGWFALRSHKPVAWLSLACLKALDGSNVPSRIEAFCY